MTNLTAHEAFLEAFLHEDYEALGKRLHPFCLRHWLLLSAMESPLLSGSRIPTIEDMQDAICVLATSSQAEFRAAMRFPNEEWRTWRARTLLVEPIPVLTILNDYIRDYFPAFPFWESDEAAEERVPALFVCAGRVLGAVGRETVMNMPLGEMVAWGLSLLASTGEPIKNLMTQAEYDGVRQYEAAMAAAGAAPEGARHG